MFGVGDDAVDMARRGAEGEAIGNAQQGVGDVHLLVEMHDRENCCLFLLRQFGEWREHAAHVGF